MKKENDELWKIIDDTISEIEIKDYVKENSDRFNIESETTTLEKDLNKQEKDLNKQEKNRKKKEKETQKIEKNKKKRKKKRKILLVIVLILLAIAAYLGYKNYKMYLAKAEMKTFPAIAETIGMKENVNSPILTNETASIESIDEVIGYIKIPAVEMEAPILQAKSNAEQNKSLSLGIAHDPVTLLPGEVSKTVLSGHREEDFAALEHVQVGDLIIVAIEENVFLYESTYVGHIDDDPKGINRVFKKSSTDELTLYTCFPFKWMSPIDGRWIVEAKRISQFDQPIVVRREDLIEQE